MRITDELITDLAHYNAGINAARAAYHAPEPTGCVACGAEHLCQPHRRKAEADLLVATSIQECAELLVLLDLPSPTRRHKVVKPCGTPAAYARHLRHNEEACEPCLRAFRADKAERNRSDRNRASNAEAARRYRAAKKSGGRP